MVKSIFWITPDVMGAENGLGYSFHNRMMRKHTGNHIDINDPFAKVFLQIAPADMYQHVEGKINVLFTMWEFPELPDNYIENLGKADYVLVPCKFCQDIFRPYTKREPIIFNEGIDSKDFPFYQRKFPDFSKGERFRIFWSGARNPRKGYQYAIELTKVIENNPNVEIYMKTHAKLPSRDKLFDEIEKFQEAQDIKFDIDKYLDTYISTEEVRVLGKHKNIFFDMRQVPFTELRKMYNDAHVFLFPTTGEGWGLMGTEALATGCPLIATNVTGVRDWFDLQVGYDLDWTPIPVKATNYGDMMVSTFSPILQSVIDQVSYVYTHYDEALAKGKRGSKRMHDKFRWEQQGIKLAKWLEKLEV